MKILVLRKVLFSLIFGCISSVILLNIQLKDRIDYIDMAEFPLVHIIMLQTLFFSIVFLYVSLLLQLKRESLKEGNRFKVFKKLALALQILLGTLTVSVFYLPILGNFFYMFSILSLCAGAIFCYQGKSTFAFSFIVWGLAILILTYLMHILTYGTW